MPVSMKQKNIKWRGSEAREVLLGDLENYILPLDDDEYSAAEAWRDVYSRMAEFEEVPFKQFEKQLKAHRKQVQRREDEAIADELRLANFRIDFPAPVTFRGSPTHVLLRKDVEEEMEQGDGYEMAADIFQSLRPEYEAMPSREFGQRLRQERRYRKFCNHLEAKRESVNHYAEPEDEEDESGGHQSGASKKRRVD